MSESSSCPLRYHTPHSSRLMLYMYSIQLRQLYEGFCQWIGSKPHSFDGCYFLPFFPLSAKRTWNGVVKSSGMGG